MSCDALLFQVWTLRLDADGVAEAVAAVDGADEICRCDSLVLLQVVDFNHGRHDVVFVSPSVRCSLRAH